MVKEQLTALPQTLPQNKNCDTVSDEVNNQYKKAIYHLKRNKHIFGLGNKKMPASPNHTSFQEFYQFCLISFVLCQLFYIFRTNVSKMKVHEMLER